MRIEYHPLTETDLNRAISYYNKQQVGLGDELRTEVYSAIERIAKNHLGYAEIEQNVRRCPVRRFPYSVIFRVVDANTLLILVIRHHRRHPRFGLGRR